MKTLLIVLTAAVALAALPFESSDAHGRGHARARVSIGFGYPAFGYYPVSYYGYDSFGIWPRYRRARVVREGAVRSEALYVYPAAGQSASQLALDRNECEDWAAEASGYEPDRGAGTRSDALGYGRAFTACMEGRGYVVR